MAGLFVILAAIGGVKSYSPIPFWDSWGIYSFFEDVSSGNPSSWWAQHNEHRILFTRALQWLDIRLFGGSIAFLIAVNYLLAGLICITFLRALADALPDDSQSETRTIAAALIVALCFSWLQMENFTWDYQSQFLGAHLFPLLGVYALYRAQRHTPSAAIHFLGAILAGIISVGTMANGILTLPMLAALAWLYGAGRIKTTLLAGLSLLTIGLYLVGYQQPGGQHATILQALEQNPLLLVQNTLIDLGGPVYHVLGMHHPNAGLVAGLAILLVTAYLAVRALSDRSRHALELAMLAFVLYVIGTAFITTAGRIHFATDRPYLPSRYMTPILMAWAALFIALVARIAPRLERRGPRAMLAGGALAIMLMLTPFQFRALVTHDDKMFLIPEPDLGTPKTHEEQNFSQMMTALALELRVKDLARLEISFPDPDLLAALARPALIHDWSLFGDPIVRDAGERLGSTLGTIPNSRCRGHLDGIGSIDGDARYLRFLGWIYAKHDSAVPRAVMLVDRDRHVIGYGLSGQPRPDVRRAVGRAAALSGFEGYLLPGRSLDSAWLVGLDPDCYVALDSSPETSPGNH